MDHVSVDRPLSHPSSDALTRAIRERPEVLEAYLFGSQARGDSQAHSDVDVAVYIDRELAGDPPFGYPAELASVLSSALGRNDVDVVLLNDAPPMLYGRALNDGVRLFTRDLRATTVREGQALSRYCDYLPQLRKIEAAHSARIARGDFGRTSPGEIDAALVRRHLLLLDRALAALRRHRGRSIQALEDGFDELWTIERGSQVCAQNVIDVATHIAAGAGRDVPDHATAIDRLGELGVLTPEFAARFRSVAGLRNVLVHGYLDVDVRIVHRLLNERLEDFTEFARGVEAYLTRKRA